MDVEIQLPLRRIPWQEAMERYGSDKPDTRFGFELHDLSNIDVIRNTEFMVFRNALDNGGDVRGICITGGSPAYSRKNIDKLNLIGRLHHLFELLGKEDVRLCS